MIDFRLYFGETVKKSPITTAAAAKFVPQKYDFMKDLPKPYENTIERWKLYGLTRCALSVSINFS